MVYIQFLQLNTQIIEEKLLESRENHRDKWILLHQKHSQIIIMLNTLENKLQNFKDIIILYKNFMDIVC